MFSSFKYSLFCQNNIVGNNSRAPYQQEDLTNYGYLKLIILTDAQGTCSQVYKIDTIFMSVTI